jgi:hypothetical protein
MPLSTNEQLSYRWDMDPTQGAPKLSGLKILRMKGKELVGDVAAIPIGIIPNDFQLRG